MHFRKLVVVVGAVIWGWVPSVLGLGLGEVTLNSALNQPLDAEIRLLQVRDLTQEEIRLTLASQQIFNDYGVERPFFLQNLVFNVELNNPSGPIVRVTTREPVREPFLNFIVELQSPNARLLREYTLLMDLPVFDDQQPTAPVQPAQTPAQPQPAQPAPRQQQPAQTQTRPAPSPAPRRPAPPLPTADGRPTQPASTSPRTAPTVRAGADAYTVRANDTLWEIALAVRPDRSVSVQQTMLALQRLNPDAFINDNINLLRRGQVLRLPDRSEILRLGQQDAVNEVAYQNNQWQSGSAVGAELVGSRTRSSQPDSDGDVRGQVRLSAPGDTQGADSRSGGGDAQAQIESLQNELAINLEELDKSQRENGELRSRISELEEQIETMERLIDLNNQELRDLQVASEQTAQQQETEGQQSADAASELEIETTDATDEQAEQQPPADVQASAAPEAPPAQAQERPQTQQPAPRPAAPQKSMVETIVDALVANLLYIGIAVVLILAGVFFFIHRRTQAEMEAYDSLDDDEFYEQDVAEEQAPLDDDEFAAPVSDDELDIGADLEEPEDEEPETPTEAETGDAVAEADIYIAYGKYDQAAEMLQKAIINDPQNLEARLKLLEVYSETKDVEKFDMEYGHLIALGEEGAMARAAEMRGNIPGIGQYQGETAGSSGLGGLEMDFDSDADTGGDGQDDFSDTGLGSEFDTDNDIGDFEESQDLSLDTGDSDFGELSLDLDDEPAADVEADNDDGGLDLQLDLDEPDTDDNNLVDLSDDFAATEPESESEAEGDGLDFSLDLDDEKAESDSVSDLDLSLDLDTETDSDTSLDTDDDIGDELSLDLNTAESDVEPASGADSGLSLESDDLSDDLDRESQADDVLADLEFGSDDLDLDSESESSSDTATGSGDFDLDFDLEEANETTPAKTATSDDSDSSDLDDDFDVDMGDLDLAALDQEMDELVGGLDDIDDDEETTAAPTEVMQALDEDFSEKDLGLSDASSDSDTLPGDDSDLADFGDDLAFGSGSAGEAEASPPAAEDGEGGIGEDMNAELDFLADTDEVATKLDLARAYIDMGDKDGARDILDEVTAEGNAEQQQEAKDLLGKLG